LEIGASTLIKRNPFIAAVLSLLTPGMGQIYNGQPKKGFVFLIVPMLILFVSAKLGFITSFPTLVETILVSYAFALYVLIDTIIASIKRKSINRTFLNKWYIYLIIILLMSIIALLFGRNVIAIRPFVSNGPSMSPTLLTNDRFMITTDVHHLERGEIVIFNAPEGKIYVKRIIGLGGDTIEIKNNSVYLNGTELAEPYIVKENIDFNLIKVPEGSYFVLGDNRPNSHDSRAMGPINEDKIIGKALFVFYENGELVFDKKL
jgi:signal peptidase I